MTLKRPHLIPGILVILLLLIPAAACKNNSIPSESQNHAPLPQSTSTTPKTVSPPASYTFHIVNIYPHDITAFTQGLAFQDGVLYEGTGLEGQSMLRSIDLASGKTLNSSPLPPEIFGEGIVLFDGKILQLSWKNQWAFVSDQKTLKPVTRFQYPMPEGWGITCDGTHLIMSDGSATLYLLNKEDFSEIGRIQVRDQNGPVAYLNELEYIEGEIWANVWQTNDIVRIDPSTGRVTGRISLAGLLQPSDMHPQIDVMNGIAYDRESKRIFVTGKNWPKLFEIEVIKK